MIVLDTHVWIWWVNETGRLTPAQQDAIAYERQFPDSIGISAVSCIEVARLSASGQLALHSDTLDWLRSSLSYANIHLLPITPEIAVRAYRLPEPFHRDPADRILVATALEHSCSLVTSDARITDYPHVQTIS